MSTSTFPYLLLRVITKRASRITVARWPISQPTSSNNSKSMKCDVDTIRMLSHASYHGSSIDIAVIWRCALRTTVYSSVSMVITFELWTGHIDLFRLSAIRHEYGRPLSASNTSSNVVVHRRKRFSRNRRPLSWWLVVRPRPSGLRLTSSPVYAGIYSRFRPTPTWEVSTELHLCFQPIIDTNSSNSISIGSRATEGLSRGLGPGFVFPISSYPSSHCSRPH